MFTLVKILMNSSPRAQKWGIWFNMILIKNAQKRQRLTVEKTK